MIWEKQWNNSTQRPRELCYDNGALGTVQAWYFRKSGVENYVCINIASDKRLHPGTNSCWRYRMPNRHNAMGSNLSEGEGGTETDGEGAQHEGCKREKREA